MLVDDEELRQHARSFGAIAAAYDRGRPGYPEDAVRWLVGRDAATVVELGAGTGKLTRSLSDQGHDVWAFDVDADMIEVLRDQLPGVRAEVASAEEIPVEDRFADVVVVAQAFHWFDHRRALPEIARILKPGGHIALVWNLRDERIPWVKRLGRIISAQGETTDSVEILAASDLFEDPVHEGFKNWQDVNRDSIVDLVASRSYVAVLSEEERAAKLAEVVAFYDEYGRGYDGMQLPYRTECFRARVVDQHVGDPDDGEARVSDGTDTDMLLIDFR